MKKLVEKLCARAGESFAEILIALLIVAFATILLVGMYAASGAVNVSAKEQDADFYEDLMAVENGTVASTENKVMISEVGGSNVAEITVDVYSDGAFTAYRKKAG